MLVYSNKNKRKHVYKIGYRRRLLIEQDLEMESEDLLRTLILRVYQKRNFDPPRAAAGFWPDIIVCCLPVTVCSRHVASKVVEKRDPTMVRKAKPTHHMHLFSDKHRNIFTLAHLPGRSGFCSDPQNVPRTNRPFNLAFMVLAVTTDGTHARYVLHFRKNKWEYEYKN